MQPGPTVWYFCRRLFLGASQLASDNCYGKGLVENLQKQKIMQNRGVSNLPTNLTQKDHFIEHLPQLSLIFPTYILLLGSLPGKLALSRSYGWVFVLSIWFSERIRLHASVIVHLTLQVDRYPARLCSFPQSTFIFG